MYFIRLMNFLFCDLSGICSLFKKMSWVGNPVMRGMPQKGSAESFFAPVYMKMLPHFALFFRWRKMIVANKNFWSSMPLSSDIKRNKFPLWNILNFELKKKQIIERARKSDESSSSRTMSRISLKNFEY